jgi:hypothetical protein
MIIELDGEVTEVSFKTGSWMMHAKLRQSMPENGFRFLGDVAIRITKEDADELTETGLGKPLKILVEIGD